MDAFCASVSSTTDKRLKRANIHEAFGTAAIAYSNPSSIMLVT